MGREASDNGLLNGWDDVSLLSASRQTVQVIQGIFSISRRIKIFNVCTFKGCHFCSWLIIGFVMQAFEREREKKVE